LIEEYQIILSTLAFEELESFISNLLSLQSEEHIRLLEEMKKETKKVCEFCLGSKWMVSTGFGRSKPRNVPCVWCRPPQDIRATASVLLPDQNTVVDYISEEDKVFNSALQSAIEKIKSNIIK